MRLHCARPREIDGEHAALPREIAHPEAAAAGLDGAAGNRQPEADPRSVAAALNELREQVLGVARGQASTLVGDLDEDPIVALVGTQ